jgi:selT/selW/selH-like putative selenoprotein
LAAELRALYPEALVRMHQSSGGVFEVTVDDAMIYSKRATGRHAEPGEVKRLLQEAINRS